MAQSNNDLIQKVVCFRMTSNIVFCPRSRCSECKHTQMHTYCLYIYRIIYIIYIYIIIYISDVNTHMRIYIYPSLIYHVHRNGLSFYPIVTHIKSYLRSCFPFTVRLVPSNFSRTEMIHAAPIGR